MPYFQSTYHSKTFRDFKEIEQKAFRQIIRFYEEREEEICRLELEEYFECLVGYVEALFEIGAYQKHRLMADLVIEASIQNNIHFFKGKDIFRQMLFKKAASLYNIGEYDQSDYILRELIKMNPDDRDAILFLKKCLRRKRPGFVMKTRATAVLLFLLSAFVISLEVLFVRPFYEIYASSFESSRIGIFLLGWIMLASGDFIHRWRVDREVNQFAAYAKTFGRHSRTAV